MKSYSSTPPAEGAVDQATAEQSSAANDIMQALLIECGVVLSMACCYLVGNSNLGSAWLFRLNPLYSLPLLLLFVAFCWYRLDFAVGLFPLVLPFSFVPKPLYAHVAVDLAELTLLVCLGVALLQLAWQRRSWKYWASWRDLPAALGPFRLPILLFTIAALGVTILTGSQQSWQTLRLVVLEPIVYVCLMLICLRAHSRVERVLWSLFVAGCMLFFSLLIRSFFFQVPVQEGLAAGAASARFVRVFLDALAPLCFALCVIGTWQGPGGLRTWTARLTAGLLCVLLLLSLLVLGIQTSIIALLVALAFLLGALAQKRKRLISGVLLLAGLAVGGSLLFWPGLAPSLVGVRGVGDLLRDFPLLGPLGLLAGAVLLLLFFWTFARVLVHLSTSEDRAYMRWIALGLGGALAITAIQALIDGMVLAQSTWYLYWAFLGTLLLLRCLTNAAWRGPLWGPQPSAEVRQQG
jgi:hypothetical protein